MENEKEKRKMANPTYEEIQELSNKLLEYSDIEGTEAGEYWRMISELNSYYYMSSPKFYSALKKELEYQLKCIKEDYEIVETEVQKMSGTHIRKELKFKE